jgi:hypothetical protein
MREHRWENVSACVEPKNDKRIFHDRKKINADVMKLIGSMY